ncbi:MAG: amidase [Pseudomonadota bacterium]
MSSLDLSAVALSQAVRARNVTPQAVAAEAQRRVAERNPAINAICALNPEFETEADKVAQSLDAGADLPLAGVPVVIKDNIWVKDLRIAAGSRVFANHMAPEDAEAVRRLREAGAMILGIATCTEFACKGAADSPLHGVTHNPVDTRLTTGGSSSGPAAAVGASIVPLALGTDAGGSSRRPPAHVGVCGYKPTQDLIPYGPGFTEPVPRVSVICPIARHMDDIALSMSVLADTAPQSPAKIRITASHDFGLNQALDPDVISRFDAAMAAIRTAGGEVETAEINWPKDSAGVDVLPLQYAGLALLYGAQWQADPSLFDPLIGQQIKTGLQLSGIDVAAALQASDRIRTTLLNALNRYGVIATPTTPCAAWRVDLLAPPEIGGRPAAPRDHAAFTSQANHAGCPALSIPCGSDTEGRPLGLQLIAAPGQDAALLGLGQAIAPIVEGVERCAFC